MNKKTHTVKHAPYIIRSSGNVTMTIRVRDAALTVILWGLYVYMLQDFFVFVGDIYHWLHDGTGTAKAYPKLRIFQTLELYSDWLLAMAAIFVSWALYNRLRFYNKKRRKTAEAVTIDDLSKMYHLEAKDLKEWQGTRSLTLHHDAKGRLTEVESVR